MQGLKIPVSFHHKNAETPTYILEVDNNLSKVGVIVLFLSSSPQP